MKKKILSILLLSIICCINQQKNSVEKSLLLKGMTRYGRLKQKVNITYKDLHSAIHSKNLVQVIAMLEECDNIKKIINAKDECGRTALHLALEIGALDIAEFLIEKDAKVNAKDHLGDTPLHIATHNGYQTLKNILLANGANPNAVNNINIKAINN